MVSGSKFFEDVYRIDPGPLELIQRMEERTYVFDLIGELKASDQAVLAAFATKKTRLQAAEILGVTEWDIRMQIRRIITEMQPPS